MGFVDKFKNMFVSIDDEYEEDEMDTETEYIQRSKPEKIVSHRQDFEDGYDADEDGRKKGNKVVNIHATTQLQVILVKPDTFEEASSIADHLNAKRTVVLNLESATKELSRRLIDFLSGVAYANNGQIKRVANSTFIITPYNVDIMGDLIDELENNGVYF